MPRANRHYTAGYIWHLTHRCHKKDFLFKFRKERLCWIRWLYEAKKRYRIKILNYIVTSNHIHLLVKDDSGENSISKFMQLLESRTAQDYNNRKHRQGAFWEDRYHATAIESESHLIECMVYISLNMVRAGVVEHPVEWRESGYHEIEYPKMRYAIIDYTALLKILNIESIVKLQESQKEWIKEAMERNKNKRESKWTEAIAVGSQSFLETIKQQLDMKAKARKIIRSGEGYELSESDIPYNPVFDIKNIALSSKKH